MSEKAENSNQEKQHATTMSDALFKQGCLAIGLSSSEVARIMGETDEPEASRKAIAK